MPEPKPPRRSGGKQGPRKPRVAGLRNRPQQPEGDKSNVEEQATTPAESEETEQPGESESESTGSESTASGTASSEIRSEDAGETDDAAAESESDAASEPVLGAGFETSTTDTAPGSSDDSPGSSGDSPRSSGDRSSGDSTSGSGSEPSESTEGVPSGKRTAGTGVRAPRHIERSAAATSESGSAPSGGDAEGGGGSDDTGARDEPATTSKPGRLGNQMTRLRRSSYGLAAALALLGVLCAGLAVWFRGEAEALETGGGTNNSALVDEAATSEVIGQVRKAVETLFSYEFTNTAKTENAAKNLLTGSAVDQYNQLFDTVKKQAPQQKMVLTTTVKSIGVKQLQGDRAVLLVFADQQAVRTDNGQKSTGPAQLTVNAVKQNGQWKIAGIEPR